MLSKGILKVRFPLAVFQDGLNLVEDSAQFPIRLAATRDPVECLGVQDDKAGCLSLFCDGLGTLSWFRVLLYQVIQRPAWYLNAEMGSSIWVLRVSTRASV